MEACGSKPESLLETASRLFKSRDRFENELRNTYEDLESVLTSDTKRKTKVESLLGRAEEKLQKAITTNNQLRDLAQNTNDPQKTIEDLDQWLQNAMAYHDKTTTMARDYLDGTSDKATEDAESVPSHKSIGSRSNKSSQPSSRAASMTSSQRRRALEATKLRAQEAERQTAAAMQLEKDRFDLRLKEYTEEKRRKLNELKIDEMELADDSSVAIVNLAPLGVNDEDGGTGNLTADWVHSIVNQTEREMGVPLPTDVVSPASRGLDQATSSILDNVKSTTHIEDILNQFADNAATDQSNVIDNTIVPSLQQHLNFNSEAVAELRPNVFGSTVISTSHSQQRPVFNGQSSLLTNSYNPKMSLWVNNHAAATTSSSLTTTRPAPIFTACTNTNVVSTNAVIPPRAHGSVHYGSSPFPTQTLVLPNTGPISAPTGHLTPFAASTINVAQPEVTMQNLVEALKSNRKGPLPEWTLSKYDGDPLSWHEWSGQFKSAIDSANLTDDEKLTYLKTLVTGKAKLAIADVAYSGRFYRDSLKTLERKFGQPQVVVGAYFDKLASYTPVKIHSSEQIIDCANFIASIIGVFRSLNYENDLRGAAMLNQAVYKLPPNLREQWSMHTVVKDMLRPTLIDFNDWLKRKAEAHERMNVSGTSKPKAEESKVKSNSKSFSATAAATGSTLSTTPRHARRTNPESKFLPCPFCKSKHLLWKCDEFKTKTPTQRAKLAADNNFCFRCVNGVHRASECDKDIQCTSPDCQNPRQHKTLLHGASRIFPLRQKKSSSPKSNKTASATVSSGISLPVVMPQRISTQGVLYLSFW